MFARPLTKTNNERDTFAFEENRMLLRGDNPDHLPQGDWEIEVKKGDAWVFSADQNLAVHPGEHIVVTRDDGEVTVRSLYNAGNVHYIVKTVR